ncbi:MAG: hypothetical protein ACLTDV_04710 [Eubacterium sp.]
MRQSTSEKKVVEQEEIIIDEALGGAKTSGRMAGSQPALRQDWILENVFSHEQGFGQ